MKFNKLFTLGLAALLTFNISCRNNDDPIVEVSKGAYENGILIANEGGFSTPTSSVTFLSNDLSKQENAIFASNNNNALLGNVFQTIGFNGDNAFLVLNVPNKIEVVNRYSFKRTGTITQNLSTPRYISFSGNFTYVTNNDFASIYKLNIYDQSNAFVKSISFPRYAEKVVTADAFVYVQTDGVTYDSNYNEIATGHTIARINTSANTVDSTITLPDTAVIRDMKSDGVNVYVLTSDTNNTYLYKILGKTGVVTQTLFSGIKSAKTLALDNSKLYFLTDSKQVYEVTGTTATARFSVEGNFIYGFNIIDGNTYVADATFTKNSTVRIYNNGGSLVKTITAGIGTSGFYKN